MKNKKTIAIIAIAIISVIAIIAGSTYAYWQITKTQKTPNDIVAACLDISLSDESPAIDLDSAWPISDDEASSLTGYTFEVTNNCDEEINYIVGLNRVEESNYLLDSSIKVRLDDNSSHVYGELSDVDYVDAENTYTARTTKQVSVETIGANGSNEHTIRVWINEEAPVTEQSKTFLGQVFIIGGQGIEMPSCFAIANNGTIVGYDESCGSNVVVPSEVNGIQVKRLTDQSITTMPEVLVEYAENADEDHIEVIYSESLSDPEAFHNFLKAEHCDDLKNCNLEEEGVMFFDNLEDYNAFDWGEFTELYDIYGISYNNETGEYYWPDEITITTLDLSDAIYLETIGESAFFNITLQGLILPQNGSLTTIEPYAFSYNNLSEVIIPSSVVTIGDSAFYDAGLSTIAFEDTTSNPSQLQTIGALAFHYNKLTMVVIPSTVTLIEDSAFSQNESLTEAIIKNTEGNITVTGAFPDTTKLTYNPNYTE